MKILRKLALVWMFAWLPISGVMATTMPFCAQGIMGMMQTTETAASGTDAAAGASHCDKSKRGSPESQEAVCEHCDLCHIAGAIVPPSAASIGNVIPPQGPVDASRADFSSFFPDRLPRPPALSQA